MAARGAQISPVNGARHAPRFNKRAARGLQGAQALLQKQTPPIRAALRNGRAKSYFA